MDATPAADAAAAHANGMQTGVVPVAVPRAAPGLASEGHVADCVFCQLSVDASADAGTRVLYADERVYVIPDRRPGARLHLLVITRKHVRDCNAILAEPQLMAHIRHVGEQMLLRYAQPGEQTRLGFHVPPFTSVPHLHLHVQAGNFRGLCSEQCSCCEAERCCAPCGCLRGKYTPWCCWYRSIGAQERRLEKLRLKAPAHEQMATEV